MTDNYHGNRRVIGELSLGYADEHLFQRSMKFKEQFKLAIYISESKEYIMLLGIYILEILRTEDTK